MEHDQESDGNRISDKEDVSMERTLTLKLPQDFIDLCEEMEVEPGRLLKSFVADLCDLSEGEYNTDGSDERMYAWQYVERCGYSQRPESACLDSAREGRTIIKICQKLKMKCILVDGQ